MQIAAGGEPLDRSEVARDLIQRLDYWYEASRSRGIEILNRPWQDHSEHLGKTVRVTTTTASVSGRLVAIDLRRGLTVAVPVAGRQETADGNACELACLPITDILMLEGEANDPGSHDTMSE